MVISLKCALFWPAIVCECGTSAFFVSDPTCTWKRWGGVFSLSFSPSLSLKACDSFHLLYSERNKEADAGLGWDTTMKMKREGESVSSDWTVPEVRRVCGREMQPLAIQITFYGSCVAAHYGCALLRAYSVITVWAIYFFLSFRNFYKWVFSHSNNDKKNNLNPH